MQKNWKTTVTGLSMGFLLHFGMVQSAQSAVIASADQTGGYSNAVLDKIVEKWQPPVGDADSFMRIMVEIDGDGKVTNCMVVAETKGSKNSANLCASVKKMGSFAKPPYGLPADVYVSFWSTAPKSMASQNLAPVNNKPNDAMQKLIDAGPVSLSLKDAPPIPRNPVVTAKPMNSTNMNSTKAWAGIDGQEEKVIASRTAKPNVQSVTNNEGSDPFIEDSRGGILTEADYYVQSVMRKISPQVVYPPNVPKGELIGILRVQINAKGEMGNVTLEQSTGYEPMDEALLNAARKVKTVTTPPVSRTQNYSLTFIIKNL